MSDSKASTPDKSSGASSAAAAAAAGDWRQSVEQSYRSEEVRNIAKVLASLEPGATSASKLMLAMRFEDAIFQQASSLPDYRKRLTKRLKKVQKSYKPPPAEVSSTEGAGGTDAEEEARRLAKEADIERDLRRQYGEDLRFIVVNAKAAVQAMEEKHGKARSDHLRQHTDNAEQWAVEIGLDESLCPHRKRRTPREPGYLDRLRSHLEQRVDNIRSHVVKLTHPDLFLEETLEKLEGELDERTMNILAEETAAIIERHKNSGHPIAPLGPKNATEMRALLEKLSAPIPPARNAAGVRDANLIRIEKIRAASQAFSSYLCLDAHNKAEVKDCLSKSHKIASEEASTFMEELPGLVQDTRKQGEVRLEDAWNKPIEYEIASAEADADDPAAIEGDEPAKKKPRTDVTASPSPASVVGDIAIRSKVLLTRGRKAPSNLVVALKSKKAEMITPSSSGALCGAGTQLKIPCGHAFELIVYFVPLLVSIRAINGKQQSQSATKRPVPEGSVSGFRRTIVDGGLPTWIPSSRGLVEMSDPLSILGVTGPASTLAPVVAKKLEYASACATRALRRCFADVARKAYDSPKISDFEVEISEAAALLRFVQLVRTTYTPDFQEE